MRGGAPLFELTDGVCRRETRAELIPHARRTNHHLSPRLRASPLSSNGHERAAEGAPTAFAEWCRWAFFSSLLARGEMGPEGVGTTRGDLPAEQLGPVGLGAA